MSTETLPARRGLNVLETVQESSFGKSWLYRFILFPIGQIIVFVAAAALILTLLAYLVAILFPEPRPNIILVEQINRQLPGMIISGISIGFVYAMVALGYTLVYGVLKFINFAHSEFFMVGAVVGFEVMQQFNERGWLSTVPAWIVIVLTVLIAMLGSGLLAMVVEYVAYRPLRNAPRLVPLITAIGISFILQDLVRAIMAFFRNDFNLTYPIDRITGLGTAVRVPFGENTVNVRPTSIIIVGGAVLMLLALNYFVSGTKVGRGIRAISQDRVTAGLMGINVNLMVSITFFIGGALGGAAGALYGMNVGTINPYVGFIPGLKAFTAAVLGGIGNVTGALLGGLLIGMIESFLNGTLVYFPALGGRFTDVFTFGVLILILVFRPSGLLGERVDEKV